MRALRFFIFAVVVVAVALVGIACSVERLANRVSTSEAVPVSERAAVLHARAFVADLHADSLLWGRDLGERSTVGHVDLPRLRDGGVALQAFTVVTQVPWTINIERNSSNAFDVIRLLAMMHLWPSRTWELRIERAIFQAERLESFAKDSGGKLRIIKTKKDLEDFVAARAADRDVVGGILGIEGAHALDGGPATVERLFGEGFRMIGFAHFFDNEYSGSAHGSEKGGLTEQGKDLLKRMESLGIVADLAHVSPAAIDDVLALATRPVVVSHTGIKATCDNRRNLDDDQLRRIAATGGVIGIGYWETATCGRSAREIAKAIQYAAELVGDEHVALGSDFDGAVTTPFDTSGLRQITQALLDAGLSEESILRILGGNVHRLFATTLP